MTPAGSRRYHALRLLRSPVLLLAACWLGWHGCAATLPPVAQMTDTDAMTALRGEFQAERWAKTVLTARAFLSSHPGSKHLDEAMYILAQASYEEGSFLDAEDYYRRLLRDFPQSEYAEDSAYYLGLAILSQSRDPGLDQAETQAAHVQLRSFLSQYPNSRYADRARHHIATIREKLAHKEYENAKVYDRAGTGARYAARFYYEKKVYGPYPETSWAAKALIKLCELEKDRLDWNQVAVWAGRYLADFPEGDDRDRAQDYLDEARHALGRDTPPAAERPAPDGAGEGSPEPRAGGGRR